MGITLDTLEYARRLRQAGFSEQLAEGQARALAAVMTESLATKEDLRGIEVRLEELEKRSSLRLAGQEERLSTRLEEQEKRNEIRLRELSARFDGRLADLERRITLRLGGTTVAGIGMLSALVRVL